MDLKQIVFCSERIYFFLQMFYDYNLGTGSSTTLHGSTAQKTYTFTTVKTSNLVRYWQIC
jgi:hypothetical protein